jgi:hypothetical protein
MRLNQSVRWRIGRDAKTLELFVDDGRDEDVMFAEQNGFLAVD